MAVDMRKKFWKKFPSREAAEAWRANHLAKSEEVSKEGRAIYRRMAIENGLLIVGPDGRGRWSKEKIAEDTAEWLKENPQYAEFMK